MAHYPRRHESLAALRRRQAEASRIQKKLTEGGLEVVGKLPRRTNPLALYEALLAYSRSLRYDNPALMQQAAWAALQQAKQIEARVHGPLLLADLHCRAWAEFGNAYRVGSNLDYAGWALGRAREVFALGTKDPFLEIHLVELEASLAADRHDYRSARLKMLKVYMFYRRQKNDHLAGRALIKKGLYTGYAGNPQKGIRLLDKAIALIEGKSDSALLYAALHNKFMFLIDSARFADARKFRLRFSRELACGTAEVHRVSLRALDGRIDEGLGKYPSAEATFREVRERFKAVGRNYHAALAGLHLSIALLSQRKTSEAKQIALESVAVFTSLRIGPDAMAAVVILREAFEMRVADLSLLKRVTEFLWRADLNPTARFSLKNDDF